MVALEKVIRERLYGSFLYWGTWIVTNVIYLCLAFVCWDESLVGLMVFSTICGVLQMIVMMGLMGGIAGSDRGIVDVLRYYPVSKKQIRGEFYRHMTVIVVVQGLLSFLPTLMTISDFSFKHMCSSAITYIVSLLAVGILTIEGYVINVE